MCTSHEEWGWRSILSLYYYYLIVGCKELEGAHCWRDSATVASLDQAHFRFLFPHPPVPATESLKVCLDATSPFIKGARLAQWGADRGLSTPGTPGGSGGDSSDFGHRRGSREQRFRRESNGPASLARPQ